MAGPIDVVSSFLGSGLSTIAVTLLLLGIFIYSLSLLLSSPKPGPNPFQKDDVRPPGPLIHDLAARDKVLKQRFTLSKIPQDLDAVVIGSGIGGLASAALLAKAGKRVLVLEQHDRAGGCCHTFVEKGFEFDIGIHYIGEMRNNTVSRLLVDQLTEGQLQWVHLQDEFDLCVLGEEGSRKVYPFHAGSRESWKKSMLERFPQEEAALDKYLQLLKEARPNVLGLVSMKVMPRWMVSILAKTGLVHLYTRYFRLAGRTTAQVLDSLTDNADLKAVLAYSFGDYGTIPTKSSFTLHAALINHYLYGASYPLGGASEIPFHIIPVIEKTGGRVLVNAPVTKILMRNGRAMGVSVRKGQEILEIHAPLIISDAGAVNTLRSLLPKEVALKSGISKLIGSKVDVGVGCLQVFVGLKGNATDLGLDGKNVWAYPSNDLSGSVESYMKLSPDEACEKEIPLLFVSFGSAKDPSYEQRFPGKSVCTIVTLVNWKWFAQWKDERVMKRGDDYEQLKEKFGQKVWEQALTIFPQLKDKVEYFEVGSPVSHNYYIGSTKGEIYGLDHTLARFSSPEVAATLRPDTGIPGLLLTGQDVFSCGFMGALFGGLLCASQVLERNLWSDLVEIKKKKIKNAKRE